MNWNVSEKAVFGIRHMLCLWNVSAHFSRGVGKNSFTCRRFRSVSREPSAPAELIQQAGTSEQR